MAKYIETQTFWQPQYIHSTLSSPKALFHLFKIYFETIKIDARIVLSKDL